VTRPKIRFDAVIADGSLVGKDGGDDTRIYVISHSSARKAKAKYALCHVLKTGYLFPIIQVNRFDDLSRRSFRKRMFSPQVVLATSLPIWTFTQEVQSIRSGVLQTILGGAALDRVVPSTNQPTSWITELQRFLKRLGNVPQRRQAARTMVPRCCELALPGRASYGCPSSTALVFSVFSICKCLTTRQRMMTRRTVWNGGGLLATFAGWTRSTRLPKIIRTAFESDLPNME
jgi:hypothetical protein